MRWRMCIRAMGMMAGMKVSMRVVIEAIMKVVIKAGTITTLSEGRRPHASPEGRVIVATYRCGFVLCKTDWDIVDQETLR